MTNALATSYGLGLLKPDAKIHSSVVPDHLLPAVLGVSTYAQEEVRHERYVPQLVRVGGELIFDPSKRACFMMKAWTVPFELQNFVYEAVRAYVKDSFALAPNDQFMVMESQFLYNPVGAGVSLHRDDIDPASAPACDIVVMLYTNTDYDGGEIEFPSLDLQHKPKAGDLMIFPSNIPHRVAPLTRGFRTSWQSKYCILR